MIKEKEWRFYGRRAGRKLNAQRQAALDDYYPKLEIKDTAQDGTLAPSSLFQKDFDRFILEIGFGNGERLAKHLQNEPHTGFIGAEPFSNGMSAFLDEIQTNNPDNIRVLMDDAIPLVTSLTPNCLDAIYILNPDPWHKTRHHKRRIVNQNNLDHFSRILKPNGILIMTTDVAPLAEWMVTEATLHPDFEWTAHSVNDWRNAPENWIHTRYETKGAKGAGNMNYLIFKNKKSV
jgi:tRNA (guanine-N7-)-methyltransferase